MTAYYTISLTGNMKLIADVLHAQGPLSVRDLARESGVSKPQVSMTVKYMGEAGLVAVTDKKITIEGKHGEYWTRVVRWVATTGPSSSGKECES